MSWPNWRAATWSMEMPAIPVWPGEFGTVQVSQVASMMPCGSVLSPGLLRRLVTTVT